MSDNVISILPSNMFVGLLLLFSFSVLGQRYSEFPYSYGQNHGYRSPWGPPERPGRMNEERYNKRSSLDDVDKYKDLYDEFDYVDDRIRKADKWEEFKEFAADLKENAANDPDHDWHDDLRKVIQWSRNLKKSPPDQSTFMKLKDAGLRPIVKPSPGMAGYWAQSEKQPPARQKPPMSQQGPLRFLTGKQLADIALAKINAPNFQPGQPKPPLRMALEHNAENQNQFRTEKVQDHTAQSLPKYDDFNAPIKWVPMTSNETSDGLAKVTDPKNGRNREYIINGTVFVPIIDYSLERIGFTTQTPAPALTTEVAILRSVVQNMNFENVRQGDWLAYESVLGKNVARNNDNECRGEGCQARCKKSGCDTYCSGDTCRAGCVGYACNSFCSGPGCFSMCIGERCSSKCEGLSCDARCHGEGCEASCRRLSCTSNVNGKGHTSGAAWRDHYPDYNNMNRANY